MDSVPANRLMDWSRRRRPRLPQAADLALSTSSSCPPARPQALEARPRIIASPRPAKRIISQKGRAYPGLGRRRAAIRASSSPIKSAAMAPDQVTAAVALGRNTLTSAHRPSFSSALASPGPSAAASRNPFWSSGSRITTSAVNTRAQLLAARQIVVIVIHARLVCLGGPRRGEPRAAVLAGAAAADCDRCRL